MHEQLYQHNLKYPKDKNQNPSGQDRSMILPRTANLPYPKVSFSGSQVNDEIRNKNT